MKAKIGIQNKNVWLRIILGGLLVLGAGILLFAGTSAPVEAADVLKLKSDELLIVKQNNCALAVPKATAKEVKVTCTALTPVAASAQKVNDADESKVKRKLNAGDALKVQASPNCKLVVKTNKATRVKVLCKPLPPTPRPTSTRKPPAATVYVDNRTGGQLCYELKDTGIGEKCYDGGGVSLYGTVAPGAYTWAARARCGTDSGSVTFPPGDSVHWFACSSQSELRGSLNAAPTGDSD